MPLSVKPLGEQRDGLRKICKWADCHVRMNCEPL
jgi:hypothetical protein